MADREHNNAEKASVNAENDDLDHALSSALAKYAAVEPRVGLEQRILANLLAKQAEVPHAAWWKWWLAGVAIAVLVVAVAVGWKSGRDIPPVIADHSSAIPRSSKGPETQVPGNDRNAIGPEKRAANPKAIVQRSPVTVAAAATPKLDQFPSPQPLSEQERILASYVAFYPEHAVLIAEARMEALRRDAEEIQKLDVNTEDFQQQTR
jgi:hypothetical protein